MNKKKIIEANAINLTDSSGKVRITLDADGQDGFAYITLFSKSRSHSVHISAMPDDGVEISVKGKHGLAEATLMVTPESDHCSIFVTDLDGKPAVTIGRFPYQEQPHEADVVVFKDGQPVHKLKDR